MKLKILRILLVASIAISVTSCKGFFKYSDARDNPTKGEERAKKNVLEGRGVSIGGALKGRGKGTNYEFSTSNPLWRASLETLDFMPLTSVNYSGGIIITDWYSNSGENEALKITVRFLNNEIHSSSLKVIVHEKKCSTTNNCIITEINSSIKNQLAANILKKAKIIEANAKKTKK